MKWNKLGLVKSPEILPWALTHAYIPTPILLDDRIRVLVSFWDKDKIGRLGYIDVKVSDPTEVLDISTTPALDVGPLDHFDCRGVTPMSYVKRNRHIYLFYTGWGNHNYYPYTLLTGLAVSDNEGKSFTRLYDYPVLHPIYKENYIRTAAWVLFQPELDEYWIWYVGGDDWFYADNKLTPTYDLRLVRSESLFDWKDKGSTLCMEADESLDEYAIGRPCIIREGGIYKLFYSSRRYKKGYSLGYAESLDGYNWTRKDSELGLERSQIGWDSKMQCFSYVLKTNYGTYMFYNGNEHGKDGFGVAIKEV